MSLAAHPRADQLRRAIAWIGQRRREQPDAPVLAHIEAAALEFDLTPLDEEFLLKELRAGPASPPR